MLRNSNEILGSRLTARDGDLGHLRDFYYDDQQWTIRYLMADTGEWLPHRKVLISPHALTGVHPPPHARVDIDLTRQQIEESPPIETHQPVSRVDEARLYEYYGWPYYWAGPMLWGPLDLPSPVPSPAMTPPPSVERPAAKPEDAHLRSARETSGWQGYRIQALDGPFGHLEQMLFDDRDWAIRYLVVDSRNWWVGRRCIVSPEWISAIEWAESRIYVDLNRDTIRRAPEFNPDQPLTREFEQTIFSYYNRRPYWERGGPKSGGIGIKG